MKRAQDQPLGSPHALEFSWAQAMWNCKASSHTLHLQAFVRLRAKHPYVLTDLQSRFDPYNTLSCDHELKHSLDYQEVVNKALSTKYISKFCEHENLEAIFFPGKTHLRLEHKGVSTIT